MTSSIAYARVEAPPNEDTPSSDWLIVTLADGSVLRMKVDQLVAVQDSDDLQCKRRCIRAGDLEPGRSSLIAMRMMPMLVSSAVPCSRESACADVCTPQTYVKKPERYEPLIALCDKDNHASQPIGISSYDRLVERGFTLREKHTFLCYEGDQLDKNLRPVRSAPPSICGGPGRRPAALSSSPSVGLGVFAPTRNKTASDWGDGAVSEAIESSVSEAPSSASSTDQTALNLKVGSALLADPSASGYSLTHFYALKRSGVPSIGTAHAPNECMP